MPEPPAASGEPARDAILITRPQPGASETAARVAGLGFRPVLCPVLTTRVLNARLPPPQAVATLLVTSSSAIPALPPAYRVLPLLAVGDATARRARQAGFALAASAGGDAAALAALVRRRLPAEAGTLLLAAGRHNGAALARSLRAEGYRVLRRAVYAAEPAPDLAADAVAALRGSRVRAALFFSAETARHFLRLAEAARLTGSLRAVEAVAIGTAAGVALTAAPWRCVRVAARPNQDEMLALL